MNQDQRQGKWDQLKGKVKKIWGKLRNDHFKRAEGFEDKLHGIIQEKYGDTKEAIKEKLDKIQQQ